MMAGEAGRRMLVVSILGADHECRRRQRSDERNHMIMTEHESQRLRLTAAALVTLAYLADLLWQHLHGGVITHHLLQRADMPAISNWWGLLVLPVLTWFLAGRIQRRIGVQGSGEAPRLPIRVVAGFAVALLLGALLAVSFTYSVASMTEYVFDVILLLAVLLPVYRAECVLGFVLAMSITFGAVLPTLVATVLAAGSAVIHLLLRPLVVRLWTFSKRTTSPSR
jgi:hypothetical protein